MRFEAGTWEGDKEDQGRKAGGTGAHVGDRHCHCSRLQTLLCWPLITDTLLRSKGTLEDARKNRLTNQTVASTVGGVSQSIVEFMEVSSFAKIISNFLHCFHMAIYERNRVHH